MLLASLNGPTAVRLIEPRSLAGAAYATALASGGVELEVPPVSLSGGNQQKVVLGQVARDDPRVLLLDEPTKGVDVGAKHDIHHLIRQEAALGMGCLVVSSDLPELLALADRTRGPQAGPRAGRGARAAPPRKT